MGAPVGNKNAAGPHGGGQRSSARAATLRDNPPWAKPGEHIGGYVTVGGSQHRRSTPQMYGSDVDDFKRKMGVCSEHRCNKISGHSGEHS